MGVYPEFRGRERLRDRWRIKLKYPQPVNGKLYYSESYKGLKRDAQAKEARLRAEFEVAAPVVDVSRSITWSRFVVQHYQPHAAKILRESTVRARKYILRTLDTEFGRLRMTEIQTSVIEQYVDKLVRQGLRPSTINDRTKVIRAVLRYAKELKMPCGKPEIATVPDRAKRRVQAWTPAQVALLLESVSDLSHDIFPMVLCLAVTGMRCSEVMHLRWEDVDLERQLIQLWPTEDWQPKNGKPRIIPIEEPLVSMLRGERLHPTWVFPCPRTGEPWKYWPNRKFDRARKAAGLEGGPHKLRHSYASEMAARTGSATLVAQLLGHSSTWVTERYMHLLDGHLDGARAVMQGYVGDGGDDR